MVAFQESKSSEQRPYTSPNVEKNVEPPSGAEARETIISAPPRSKSAERVRKHSRLAPPIRCRFNEPA
jgi:hypothetical protein